MLLPSVLASVLGASAALAAATPNVTKSAANSTTPKENIPNLDVTSKFFDLPDFKFNSGESIAKLRQHYFTLGTPQRNQDNKTTNAVLIMHSTGARGSQFLFPPFAAELFLPGQPLDALKYFIILPDAIGHGNSSKPSDELRARFPRYGYQDIVRATHELVKQELGVDRLRLVMGGGMGGMNSWQWAGMFPDEVDAVFPMVSLPTPIGGRLAMGFKMGIDAIQSDPAYKGGDYVEQPLLGLTNAVNVDLLVSSVPAEVQKLAPDGKTAVNILETFRNKTLPKIDANNLVYQWSAASDFDARRLLGNITAPLVAVNSADDPLTPVELGTLEASVKEVANGSSFIIPTSSKTMGHLTFLLAGLYKDKLAKLLEDTQPKR
ncbi:hypothetical protein XA68_13370 [Ophiocordyceps unilateralis]|uniref:AB hydrolase-1 domain-containing protein n=1 Tax=Ophiocordyceps unilateralis TaxID=268505 RepID=A0A2A9PM83_OPHUN|nr:hypothetical protein XA68_13370 [Ophiocordyceps unilateralis]